MSVNSGSFTFAGTSSSAYNVIVENVPAMNRPARKQTVIEVPGKSGDIIFPEDAWTNIQQGYDIFKGTGAVAATKDARALISWVHGVKGYQRLTDSFDPEIFRLAYLDGDIEIENIRNNIWRARVNFSCRPERFLLTGETVVTKTTSGSTISNPTAFNSKPLIKITGSGAVTLSVGSEYKVSISNISSYVNLDCDAQDAYKTASENKNSTVTITQGDSFPQLHPGSNTISWTGSVTKVEITPRWYEL